MKTEKSPAAFDQALWDQVAAIRYSQSLENIKHMDGFSSIERLRSCAAETAFDDADAFMAEREKRIDARGRHE